MHSLRYKGNYPLIIPVTRSYLDQGYFRDGPEPFLEKTVEDRINLI